MSGENISWSACGPLEQFRDIKNIKYTVYSYSFDNLIKTKKLEIKNILIHEKD